MLFLLLLLLLVAVDVVLVVGVVLAVHEIADEVERALEEHFLAQIGVLETREALLLGDGLLEYLERVDARVLRQWRSPRSIRERSPRPRLAVGAVASATAAAAA